MAVFYKKSPYTLQGREKGVRGYSAPCGVSVKKQSSPRAHGKKKPNAPAHALFFFSIRVVFYSAPCGFRSPSSFRWFTLCYGCTPHSAPQLHLLSAPQIGVDSTNLSIFIPLRSIIFFLSSLLVSVFRHSTSFRTPALHTTPQCARSVVQSQSLPHSFP